MAEIIAEPSALSKIIPVSFKINDTDSVTTTRLATKKQFNTTDTDAWLSFDLDGIETTGGEFDLTLINVDENPSSIFHHTSIAFSGIPFYYKLDAGEDLTKNEIRHAGRWIGQVIIRLANGDTTTRQFDFAIAGHLLDGKEARVILIEDYNALMATIAESKGTLDQYNIDYAALLTDITEAETLRTQNYNQLLADQQANIEAFDVALEEGIVAANLATKLQEFEATNDSRLLSAEQQLEQAKADILLNSRGLGETYPTLTDLQTAYPTGDTYDHIVGADGHRYYWNDTVWADGGAYQAVEVIDKAITEYKTNYLYPSGLNLYNLDKITVGYYLNQTTGALTAYASGILSDYIPVTDSLYYQKRFDDNGNETIISIVFFDNTKTFLSGIQGRVWSFTPPVGASYMRISVNVNYASGYHISRTNSLMDYTDKYFEHLKLGVTNANIKEALTADKLAFMTPKKNLFNKNKITPKFYINLSGVVNYSASSLCMSEFIEVEEGEPYYRNHTGITAIYDSTYTFLTAIDGYVATMPLNSKYVRLAILNTQLDTLQFEKGTSATAYEDYTLVIPPEMVTGIIDQQQPSAVDVDDLYITDIRTLNLFDKTKAITTGYWGLTGAYAASTYLNSTDFMPIKVGSTYSENRLASTVPIFTLWDANYNFLEGVQSRTVNVTNVNAAYLKVATLATFLNDCVIAETAHPSYLEYYPYNTPKKYLKTQWNARKMANFGDSLTAMEYWQPMINGVLGMTYTVLAQSGGNMVSIANFVENVPTDTNILTVWAGTNDWSNAVALGEFGSVSVDNYSGALKYLIEYASTTFPDMQILLITPLQRDTDNTSTWPTDLKGFPKNANGDTLEDFVNMVIEYGNAYGIPVLDMFHESGVNKFNIDAYSLDKLHPTQKGFEKLCWKIIDKIKSM